MLIIIVAALAALAALSFVLGRKVVTSNEEFIINELKRAYAEAADAREKLSTCSSTSAYARVVKELELERKVSSSLDVIASELRDELNFARAALAEKTSLPLDEKAPL